MKILDFAIDVEQAEQDLYQRLAECSPNQTIKGIFLMIASKERMLLEKLRNLRRNHGVLDSEIQVPEPQQQKIRKIQSASCELLENNEVRDDLSSYNYILRTEQLIYNLYANLKQRETDPRAQSLLDLLLYEKRQEMERISTLYDVARVLH